MSNKHLPTEQAEPKKIDTLTIFILVMLLTNLFSIYIWVAFCKLSDETASLKITINTLKGLSIKSGACSQTFNDSIETLKQQLRVVVLKYEELEKRVLSSQKIFQVPQIVPMAKEVLSSVRGKLEEIKDKISINLDQIDEEYKISEKKETLKEKIIEKNKIIQDKVFEGGVYLKQRALQTGDYIWQQSAQTVNKIEEATAEGTDYIVKKSKEGTEYLKAKVKSSSEYLKASIMENYEKLKSIW